MPFVTCLCSPDKRLPPDALCKAELLRSEASCLLVQGALSQPPLAELPAKPLDVSAAAAALAAAKAAVSNANVQNYGKVSVTETRRFAGKDIQVCRWAMHLPAKMDQNC